MYIMITVQPLVTIAIHYTVCDYLNTARDHSKIYQYITLINIPVIYAYSNTIQSTALLSSTRSSVTD